MFSIDSLRLTHLDTADIDKNKTKDRNRDTLSPGNTNSVLNQANRILDDNEDCVKQMNKFVLYAKTASIRDRQLSERKVLEDIYKKKEAKLDIMIELERLKELKCQEDKERLIQNLKRQGSLVIIDQIKEKDLERLRVKEKIEKEGIAINKQMIELEQEDKRLNEQRKYNEEKRAKEIIDIYKYSGLIREKKKIDDKEADLKIIKFRMLKEKREEEQIAEKKKQMEEKEKEIQKLREKREKEQDKKAELDNLRAKRAYEDNERRIRSKEKEESLIRQRLLNELYLENEKQRMSKEIRVAEQAQKEHNEYAVIAKQQLEEIEAERRKDEDKKKKRYENGFALKKQMQLKEDRGSLTQRTVYEEGRELMQRMDNYKQRMESIKREKLKELQSLSIDQRFIHDLERYVIK